MRPQGAGNFANPQSMFLTATATCMFGLLPEQSPVRLCLTGGKPAETKPCTKRLSILQYVQYSPPPSLHPGMELFRLKSQVASPESQVGEVPIVPPVIVGDIREADPQAPPPHRWPRIAQRGSP